jgi:ribosomal protein S21
MNGVYVYNNEDIEKAIKRFNRITDTIATEVKNKMFYEKQSIIQHREKQTVLRKRIIEQKLSNLKYFPKKKSRKF